MKRILFVVLVLSLFVLSSCAKENICHTLAEDQIPKTITLYQLDNEGPWMHQEGMTWIDGTEITNLEDISYRTGNQKGENINYFYAQDENVFATKLLNYKKQSVSAEGVILGDNQFSVNFVLKPLPETRQDDTEIVVGETTITKSVQDFEIVEKRFGSCKWYE